ncbi:MAG TPA: serine/threonine protein kinase, partial [Planctomycetota bacterium]|nr:serine/threonine protein kinase [Planctomycetota bacterium]
MGEARGPSPPPRFGAYEILEELGRGAMGVVYKARHGPTGAIRALKVVAGNPDPVSMARFRREIETLARAGGDGIVPVHEAGEERGRLYLV